MKNMKRGTTSSFWRRMKAAEKAAYPTEHEEKVAIKAILEPRQRKAKGVRRYVRP